MKKFKVGDRVKILGTSNYSNEYSISFNVIGKKGKIIYICPYRAQEFLVEIESEEYLGHTVYNVCLSPENSKLVTNGMWCGEKDMIEVNNWIKL